MSETRYDSLIVCICIAFVFKCIYALGASFLMNRKVLALVYIQLSITFEFLPWKICICEQI